MPPIFVCNWKKSAEEKTAHTLSTAFCAQILVKKHLCARIDIAFIFSEREKEKKTLHNHGFDK